MKIESVMAGIANIFIKRRWDIWRWPDGGNVQEVYFTGQDAYGEMAQVALNRNFSKAGFIVRKKIGTSEWANKDTDVDRYIENISGDKEIRLFQGDATVYDKAPTTTAKMFSYIDSDNSITVGLDTDIALTGKNEEGFTVFDDKQRVLPIVSVVDGNVPANASGNTNLVKIHAKQNLDVTKKYQVQRDGFTMSSAIARDVLNEKEYFYTGDDLGSTYTKNKTDFRLWAPTARALQILLFQSAQSSKPYKTIPMQKARNGTWKCRVRSDLNGVYYQYRITLYVNGMLTTYQVDDPYSYGSSANSGRSLIYDNHQTDPANWECDRPVTLQNNVDAIIYEAHVRDLTISDTSGVKQGYRGKYLGLTQTGTKSPQGESTGLDHLKDLGVTHVELLPTFDYGNGDETESNAGYTWYNWGYDPILYNTPEGSYATNPDGTARQNEYKQMVEALHKNGMGVIFDAVFNHTSQTGNNENSIFDKIVPEYFYRVGNDGMYFNGSGCGNDVASEKPMVRKFIVDSVKCWVKTYHLDGLRFDLMGLLDKETMQEVYKAAKAINPNIIVFGEGWDLPTQLSDDQKMTQANIIGTRIGAFNDGIRDDVKGTVVDDTVKGFAQGGGVDSLSRFVNEIKGQAMGADGLHLTSPNQTINYAACHDNTNLWDKISISNADASYNDKLKMDALTNAIILTSQGVPFFAEGDEFGRSKDGDSNSYNNNDPNVNLIDWSLKSKNQTLYAYYKGLIALRKAHPAFRMTNDTEISKNMVFDVVNQSVVQYTIRNHANGDSWNTIFVAYNGGDMDQAVTVSGRWNIVVSGEKAGLTSLGTARGQVMIPAYSTLVMYSNYGR